jgi:hypothetical protein
MDWSIEIKVDGDVLVAAVDGGLNAKAYIAAREKVRSALEKSRAQCVLFDIRRAVLHLTTMDVFDVAASNSQVIPPSTPCAVVFSSDTMSMRDARFGEDVARNRGACLKAFTDIAKAKQWLVGGPDTQIGK